MVRPVITQIIGGKLQKSEPNEDDIGLEDGRQQPVIDVPNVVLRKAKVLHPEGADDAAAGVVLPNPRVEPIFNLPRPPESPTGRSWQTKC